MSLLGKALGKIAGGLVKTATGGLVSPKINFSPTSARQGIAQQQADSVKTTSKVGPGGIVSSSSTTSYYSKQGAAGGSGMALMKAGAGCGVVWTGTRWRAQRINKSTYITRGGGTSRWPAGKLIVHPAGTECVTVRRRHVTNAKALRRAISRVKGFVKVYRKAAALVGARHRSRSSCSSCGKNPCRCK